MSDTTCHSPQRNSGAGRILVQSGDGGTSETTAGYRRVSLARMTAWQKSARSTKQGNCVEAAIYAWTNAPA